MKNRTVSAIAKAYKKIFKQLTESGFRPRMYWLDNEESELLKHFDRNKQVEFQLVPPHTHRSNPTEKLIHTRKD